jgi:hypothetical protein
LTGPELLAAAIVAIIVILPLVVLDRSRHRERALRLIAQGAADDSCDMTAMMVTGPRCGKDLAAALARALDQAERRESLPVAARPPEAVCNLASCRAEIEEIGALAESDDAEPAGLALLELSLLEGYSSPVYSSDPRTLRELFWQIRYLLLKPAPYSPEAPNGAPD